MTAAALLLLLLVQEVPEVRCHLRSGSIVLATIEKADAVTFRTPYGKLGLPTSELFSIDLLRFREEDFKTLDTKVAELIDLLGDDEDERDWRWVTGEPMTFSGWNRGEPNNSGARENYAAMHSTQGWNDTIDEADVQCLASSSSSYRITANRGADTPPMDSSYITAAEAAATE